MNKEQEVIQSNNLGVLIEAAMFAVLAFVIAFIPLDIGPFEAELGMIPIIIFSYRRGVKPALLAGFMWGFIKLASGNFTMWSILQVFVEYLFAFAVSGLAGVGAQRLKNQIKSEKWRQGFITISWSIFFAVFVKYGIHFIAGVIYWGIYAPESMGPIIYSLVVNGMSGLASFLVNGIIVGYVIYKSPNLIFTENLSHILE